jgi:NADPH:quinone reductase-like Zn-dependent oxidoreductase
MHGNGLSRKINDMKAIVYEKYGAPSDVLELKEVEKPSPKKGEVLVKVFATAVNYSDWAFVRGKPLLVRLIGAGAFKPKNRILGADIAGRVEQIGNNVKRFTVGDEVFGDLGDIGFGGFAEYVSVPEHVLALKPVNLSFEEAASVPQASIVALQGLRDEGRIKSGHKVLIYGASGGIGSFAVQIAKLYWAEVTGVCSTKNLNKVLSIGADHVIDYTMEDFTQNEERYDLILDIVANRSTSDYLRALSPQGRYVAVAFNPKSMFQVSKTGGKKMRSLSAKSSVDDLVYMKELLEDCSIVPVIDRCFPFNDTAEAVQYYGDRHSQGKVVITVHKE